LETLKVMSSFLDVRAVGQPNALTSRCPVTACGGRRRLVGAGSGSRCGVEFGRSRTGIGVFGEEEEGGGVKSGPGEARTILLLHIISAGPSKQPLMVCTFLKVHMELGSYFVSARTNTRHHHQGDRERESLLGTILHCHPYPFTTQRKPTCRRRMCDATNSICNAKKVSL